MTSPTTSMWILRNIVLILCSSALLLLSRRLTVLQIRNKSLTFFPAACAILLWMGIGAAAVGAVVACWLDARFFVKERSERLAVLWQGLEMLAIVLAAGSVARVVYLPGASLPGSGIITTAFCIAALQRTLAVIAAFGITHSIFEIICGRMLRSRAERAQQAPAKIRMLIFVAGTASLILLAPLGAAFGVWAIVPLTVVLALCALLLYRTQEVSRLRGQLHAAQAMGFVSLGDSSSMEPTAMLYRFLHLAENLIHAERSLVWIVDETTEEMTPTVGLPNMGEFAGLHARLGEGLLGSAAERIRPLIVSDASRSGCRGENELAEDSWLLYPIIAQKRIVGVAQWTRPASIPFTQQEAAQLEALVPQVGIALENLRSRSKLRELASTDGLTGLQNQRRIGETLREEMRRSERYNRPLSVLMLDVDSFKSFNDTHGHPQGDQLLRSIARILRAGVRSVDRLGRYGGEEFLIVMPETHKDDAFRLAERIRAAVETQAYVVIGGQDIHRTISVGVASYPEDGLNPHELVERADEALYRAKNSGRNCVIWA